MLKWKTEMYLHLDRAGHARLRHAMIDSLHSATDPLTTDAAIRRAVIDLTMTMVAPGPADATHDAIDLTEALDVEIRMTKARTGMAYVSLDVDALEEMYGQEVARIAAGLCGLFPRPRRGVTVWADAPATHRGRVEPIPVASLGDALAA